MMLKNLYFGQMSLIHRTKIVIHRAAWIKVNCLQQSETNISHCHAMIVMMKLGKASPRSSDNDRQARVSTESNPSRQNPGQVRLASREPTHQFINTQRREAPIPDLRRGEPRGHREFDHAMGPPRSNQQGSDRVWQAGEPSLSAHRLNLESRKRSDDCTRRQEAIQRKSTEMESYFNKDSETRFELIAG